MTKTTEAASKEARALIDKLFSKVSASENAAATRLFFPGGIGYIKVNVQIDKVAVTLVAADVEYKGPSGFTDLPATE